jgi:head-tail adaptor
MRAGELREQLVIQKDLWPAIAVTLTRIGTTATAAAAAPHNYVTGDYIDVAGAAQGGYNGRVKVTVPSPTTFTYTVDGGLATPATGTPTARYAKDAQGGRRENWVPHTTVRAQLVSTAEGERLQGEAMTAQASYRFRVRRRADLTPRMRATWTPIWPPSAPALALEIHGVPPEGNGVTSMFLDCGGIN